MNVLRKHVFYLVVILFFVQLSLPVFAQEQDAIKVHLSTETAVPGSLLAPGTYIFSRFSVADPNTIEIENAKTERVIGYFDVVPAERANADHTVVDLSTPDPAGVEMVKALYRSGERDGYRFIYSKKEIRKTDRLAQEQMQDNGSSAG